jgi:uncharacterized protein (TIGR02466 family)
MSKIELWFPVAVYTADDLLSQENNDKLKTHCLSMQKTIPSGGDEWFGKTYTTHGTHELNKDPECQVLLDTVLYHVHEFARAHNCQGTYENRSTWANISTAGSYQEFHTHNASIFSATYYVTAPEGSGRIVFEDPKEPDMFPLKNIKGKNNLSYSRISYAPTAGTLLIFRSYLRHLVEPGTNTDPRISIAMNFC